MKKNKEEILNLIRNEEDRAKAFNPLERIIEIEESDDKIVITTSRSNEKSTPVSCDGQKGILVAPGGSITIQKHIKQLQLVHPRNYSYFETLRNKLHWRG